MGRAYDLMAEGFAEAAKQRQQQQGPKKARHSKPKRAKSIKERQARNPQRSKSARLAKDAGLVSTPTVSPLKRYMTLVIQIPIVYADNASQFTDDLKDVDFQRQMIDEPLQEEMKKVANYAAKAICPPEKMMIGMVSAFFDA